MDGEPFSLNEQRTTNVRIAESIVLDLAEMFIARLRLCLP
jgi:hypothetical protein